jgi:uncharacterized protein involved in exopolysaccharide biosynthesis
MSQQELSLDTYARAIWRAKWLIIIGAIAAAAIAAVVVYQGPIQHRAVALIQIGNVWKEPIEDYFVAETVASSPGFLKDAAASANLNPRQLRRSVIVDVIQGGPRRARYAVLLRVSATSESSDDAVASATAVSKAIVVRHDKMFDEALKPHLEQQHRLEERQKELAAQAGSRELLLRVETELDDVRTKNSIAEASATDRSRVVEEPSSENVPRPSMLRPAAGAAALAAIVIAVLAALTAHFKRLDHPEANAANN